MTAKKAANDGDLDSLFIKINQLSGINPQVNDEIGLNPYQPQGWKTGQVVGVTRDVPGTRLCRCQ